MSNLRVVPPALAQMPLRYRAWIFVSYCLGMPIMGAVVDGFTGAMIAVLASMFSFQFWVYAAWNGLRKSPDMGAVDAQV